MTLDQTWAKTRVRGGAKSLRKNRDETRTHDILGRDKTARLAYANRQAHMPENSEGRVGGSCPCRTEAHP